MRGIPEARFPLGIFGALVLGTVATCWADSPRSESGNVTVLYFVRHADDQINLLDDPGNPDIMMKDCVQVTTDPSKPPETCCNEVLNPLGLERAARLAEWFEENHITNTLTHVIATHKVRTRQTVEKIALAAGLGGDLDGDGTLDGTDPDDLADQRPGDGVINVPGQPGQCDPGYTGSSSALNPQFNYLRTLPLGSRAVVASHSPVIYPLLQKFGIDTSDPVLFPKDSRGRVTGFNNLWIVELDRAGNGKLLEHLLLDFTLTASEVDREHGNGPPEEDDEE